MITAFVLATLAIAARLLSSSYQLWNLAPLGAISLYAGSRLPRRYAWLVPVAAMAISDALLDGNRSRSWLELSRLAIYASFALTTILGSATIRLKSPFWLPALSLGASTLFFVISNFATWAEGLLYPPTLTGLLACYVAAIPFFGRTILSDLAGTALLFGIGPVVERTFARRAAVLAPESAD